MFLDSSVSLLGLLLAGSEHSPLGALVSSSDDLVVDQLADQVLKFAEVVEVRDGAHAVLVGDRLGFLAVGGDPVVEPVPWCAGHAVNVN